MKITAPEASRDRKLVNKSKNGANWAELSHDRLFPAFPYGVANTHIRTRHPVWGKGEIETEALGEIAADMGIQCWGLPDLEIIHANE